jgi:hypothetical protein
MEYRNKAPVGTPSSNIGGLPLSTVVFAALAVIVTKLLMFYIH